MVHLRSRDLRTTGRANNIRYVRGIGECTYVGKCIHLLSTKIAVIYRIEVI
jgi:succinate dehydrogenase/fumarate reductase-like Fe-S protein